MMKHRNKGLLVLAALASGLIFTASAAQAGQGHGHGHAYGHGQDKDGDGLSRVQEKALKTKFKLDDTDADGLPDGVEVHLSGTNPAVADTDGDGLNDGEEIALGTEPLVEDSDEDGLSDTDELDEGTDPINEDTDDDGIEDGADNDPGVQGDEERFELRGVVTDAEECMLTLSSTESPIDARDVELEDGFDCEDLFWEEVEVRGIIVGGKLIAEEVNLFNFFGEDEEDAGEQCDVSYEDEWDDEWADEGDDWYY